MKAAPLDPQTSQEPAGSTRPADDAYIVFDGIDWRRARCLACGKLVLGPGARLGIWFALQRSAVMERARACARACARAPARAVSFPQKNNSPTGTPGGEWVAPPLGEGPGRPEADAEGDPRPGGGDRESGRLVSERAEPLDPQARDPFAPASDLEHARHAHNVGVSRGDRPGPFACVQCGAATERWVDCCVTCAAVNRANW